VTSDSPSLRTSPYLGVLTLLAGIAPEPHPRWKPALRRASEDPNQSYRPRAWRIVFRTKMKSRELRTLPISATLERISSSWSVTL